MTVIICLKALKIPKYSLLGFSDGGVTSLIHAAKYPDAVNKLVVWGANSFVLPNEVEMYKSKCDMLGLYHGLLLWQSYTKDKDKIRIWAGTIKLLSNRILLCILTSTYDCFSPQKLETSIPGQKGWESL